MFNFFKTTEKKSGSLSSSEISTPNTPDPRLLRLSSLPKLTHSLLHDLQNVTTNMFYILNLGDDKQNRPPVAPDAIERLEPQVQRMIAIISKGAKFLESHYKLTQKTSLSMKDVVLQVLQSKQWRWPHINQKFETPDTISQDPIVIRVAIEAILTYLHHETPSSDSVLNLTIAQSKNKVVLTIQDSGIVKDPAELARVMKPFKEGLMETSSFELSAAYALSRGVFEFKYTSDQTGTLFEIGCEMGV